MSSMCGAIVWASRLSIVFRQLSSPPLAAKTTDSSAAISEFLAMVKAS